jgi:hypothetical protein
MRISTQSAVKRCINRKPHKPSGLQHRGHRDTENTESDRNLELPIQTNRVAIQTLKPSLRSSQKQIPRRSPARRHAGELPRDDNNRCSLSTGIAAKAATHKPTELPHHSLGFTIRQRAGGGRRRQAWAERGRTSPPCRSCGSKPAAAFRRELFYPRA